MVSKSVAVASDVKLEDGGVPSDYDSGTWTKVKSVSTYDHLQTDGAPVAWEATGTFSFTGTLKGGNGQGSIPAIEVRLTGTSEAMFGGEPVLRDGDEAQETTYGNRVYVEASRTLNSD